MTRQEWYKSTEFKKCRNLHSDCAEISHKLQRLYDTLEIAAEGNQNIVFHDSFNLLTTQIHLMQLQASKLQEYGARVSTMLEPKIEE